MFQPKSPDWLNGYINKTSGWGRGPKMAGEIRWGDPILPNTFIK